MNTTLQLQALMILDLVPINCSEATAHSYLSPPYKIASCQGHVCMWRYTIDNHSCYDILNV